MSIYDFSQYQDTIDFGKVKSNAELVIFRVQAGSTSPDTQYKNYVAGAKANKIPFGTYAYAKFISVADAQTEATDCFNRMDKGTQFVVVDVESNNAGNSLVSATQAYIDKLHSLGVKKVGLYSGQGFYIANGLSKVKSDFLWIANYGIDDGAPHSKPSIPCDLWQYSDKARESGVVGYVDIDELNGSKPLSYFTGGEAMVSQINTVTVTGDGHGELTIIVDSANVYYAHDYSSGIKEVVKKGGVFSYYAVYQGWYNVGAGWIPQQDVAVTSFTANPKPAPVAQPKIVATSVGAPSSAVVKPIVVSGNTVKPSANASIPSSANASANVAPKPVVQPSANSIAPASANVSSNAVVPPSANTSGNVGAVGVQAVEVEIQSAINSNDVNVEKSLLQKILDFIKSVFKF